MQDYNIDDYLCSYPKTTDPNFYNLIESKKEFLDLTYTLNEKLVSDISHREYLKYQENVLRYLLIYNKLYIMWQTGSGKSVTMLGLLKMFDDFRPFYDETIVWNYLNNKHPEWRNLVFIGGNEMFLKDLRKKGMTNVGLGLNKDKTEKGMNRAATTTLSNYYQTMTVKKFMTSVRSLSRDSVREMYNNTIIVIDEFHNLRIKESHLKYVFASPEERERMKAAGLVKLTSEITKKGESDRTKFQTVLDLVWFLDLIPMKKIIIMSATPILKLENEEFILAANILLDPKDRIPVSRYDIRDMNVRKMLISKLRGMTSFVDRYMGNVSVEIVGQDIVVDPMFSRKDRKIITYMIDKISDFGPLKVIPLNMEGVQAYMYIYKYCKSLIKGNYKPFGTEIAEVALFVYPNGEFSKEGREQYIWMNKGKSSKYKGINGVLDTAWGWRPLTMKERHKQGRIDYFQNYLGNLEEDGVQYKFRQLAVKLDEVVKQTEINDQHLLDTYGFKFGCNLVVCELVENGILTLAYYLDAQGYRIFKDAKLPVDSDGKVTIAPAKRYALLVKPTPKSATGVIQDLFNHPDNYDGKYIKYIIISKIASEGLSFHHITNTFILKPFWIYQKLVQAISRGARLDAYGTIRSILDNSPVSKRLEELRSNPSPDNADEIRRLESYTPTKGMTIKSRIYMYIAQIVQDENGFDGSYLEYPPEGKDGLIIDNRCRRSYIPSIDSDLLSRSLQTHYGPSKMIDFMRKDLTYDRLFNRYRNESPETIRKMERRMGISNPDPGVDSNGNLYEIDPNYKRKYIPDKVDDSSYNLFYSQSKHRELSEQMKLLFLSKNSYSASEMMRLLNIPYKELIRCINYIVKTVIIFRQFDGRPGNLVFRNNIIRLVSSSERLLPTGRSKKDIKPILYPKSLSRFVSERMIEKPVESYPENELRQILAEHINSIQPGWTLFQYVSYIDSLDENINISRFGAEILQYKLLHEPINFSSEFGSVKKKIEYSSVIDVYNKTKDGQTVPVIINFNQIKHYKKILSLVTINPEHREYMIIIKPDGNWRSPLDKEYILYAGIFHYQLINRWRSDIDTKYFTIRIDGDDILGFIEDHRGFELSRIIFSKPIRNIPIDSMIDILWTHASDEYIYSVVGDDDQDPALSLDNLSSVASKYNIRLDEDNLLRLRFYSLAHNLGSQKLSRDVTSVLRGVLYLDTLDI